MSVRFSRKLLAVLLGASVLVACNGGGKGGDKAPEAPAEPLSLTLLHINDHHSHLDEESADFKLETAAGKREDITVTRGGFARVTALINARARASADPVIKIHAGDAVTGDLYFTISEGKADADLMNTVCFDTLTLGNHEFDNGDAGLKKFLDFLAAGGCKTQALSANVKFGASSPLKGSDLVKSSVVLERGGQKIGLVGLTIAGKTKNASRPNSDTLFEDEAVAAQAEIDRLKAQGINKIIVQSHYGYEQDKALAGKLSGVDVIVGGDSHTLLAPAALSTYGVTPAGDYPTRLVDKDGSPVCVVQAWQYSYVVGELKVDFDKDGKVSACDGTPWLPVADDFRRKAAGSAALSAAELASIRADIGRGGLLRIVSPDQYALDVLAPYDEEKTLFGAKQVAIASEDLCLRRVPGVKRDTARSSLGDSCNKADRVNQHGGDIQQLVAEAFLQQGKAYFNADLSIQNGGGVRVDVPAGPVTVGTIYTVLPFTNVHVQLKATGTEIKAALEDALDNVAASNGSGPYPYAGGLRWDVDLGKAKGSRLANLQLRGDDGSWSAFDLSRTYNVVTIDFLADGSDFYTTLGSIKGERRIDVGLHYADAFLKYVEALPGEEGKKVLSRRPVSDYSTQNFVDTP